MREYVGADIVRIMSEMPAELVAALQGAFAEHDITEREARWWGFLQFARTGAYDGIEFVIEAPSTGDRVAQRFADLVLAAREGNERHGFRPRPWPDMAVDGRPDASSKPA